ncbi:MAG: KTSC domain-containing protein [Rhodocyclaceae bacterium]|nr:KTSC domain-containing protein [Rhodocyclaceae bacterium]MCA3116385.1 KTSC domain-containing protein [Rhodocyclaceae bacterium]MCA3127060.1 KTSC domain-containing protein [Rhodocyclaceae bacterium]
MNRTPCTSSQIASHGYDPATQTLEVEFKTGAVYQYDGVPPEVADGFNNCESVGKHFGAQVRGKFPHRMLTPVAK